jgi:hypothetical protein
MSYKQYDTTRINIDDGDFEGITANHSGKIEFNSSLRASDPTVTTPEDIDITNRAHVNLTVNGDTQISILNAANTAGYLATLTVTVNYISGNVTYGNTIKWDTSKGAPIFTPETTTTLLFMTDDGGTTIYGSSIP